MEVFCDLQCFLAGILVRVYGLCGPSVGEYDDVDECLGMFLPIGFDESPAFHEGLAERGSGIHRDLGDGIGEMLHRPCRGHDLLDSLLVEGHETYAVPLGEVEFQHRQDGGLGLSDTVPDDQGTAGVEHEIESVLHMLGADLLSDVVLGDLDLPFLVFPGELMGCGGPDGGIDGDVAAVALGDAECGVLPGGGLDILLAFVLSFHTVVIGSLHQVDGVEPLGDLGHQLGIDVLLVEFEVVDLEEGLGIHILE